MQKGEAAPRNKKASQGAPFLRTLHAVCEPGKAGPKSRFFSSENGFFPRKSDVFSLGKNR